MGNNYPFFVILHVQNQVHMKRTNLLLLLCVLAGLVASATQVSQHQVRQAAEQFLKQKTGKIAASAVTVGQANPVRPFHAYFSDIYPDMTTARLTIKFILDKSSGIQDVIDQQPGSGQQDIYYNINGQRVTKPGKGIYIVGGKKVVIF